MARSPSLVLAPRRRLKAAPVRHLALEPSPAPAIKIRTPAKERLERRLQRLSVHGALSADHVELLRPAVRRSRTILACPCGGSAPQVKCTRAELARFGGESFARAFVCADCRTRYVGRARPAQAWPL